MEVNLYYTIDKSDGTRGYCVHKNALTMYGAAPMAIMVLGDETFPECLKFVREARAERMAGLLGAATKKLRCIKTDNRSTGKYDALADVVPMDFKGYPVELTLTGKDAHGYYAKDENSLNWWLNYGDFAYVY